MIRNLLWIFLLLIMNTVHAYSGFGVCNHGKETLASVICNGPTVLKQTTVTDNIEITGSLHAEGITATSVTVLGPAEISDSQVSGAVRIVGDFSADHDEFKRGVAVESDKTLLNHSIVNGTLIITSNDKTPYVQVQCSSTVKGSVLFDGKAGVVQVTGDSLVQGKIVNGATEFVKRNCDE